MMHPDHPSPSNLSVDNADGESTALAQAVTHDASTAAHNASDVDAPAPSPGGAAFASSRHAYAQVSTHDDEEDDGIDRISRVPAPAQPGSPSGAGGEPGASLDSFNRDDIEGARTESDPLYPPPPDAYYHRGQPLRVTHWGRLIATLLAVALACLAIAAVIDVSSPSDGLEPGRDVRSVADSVLAAMDRSADPCDNFYEYACGSWLRSSTLPPDRTSYSKSFSIVYDRLRLQVKDLLEKHMQETDNPVFAKAGALYASCINEHATGSVNTLFLTPYRDAFNNLGNASSFAAITGVLSKTGSTGLLDLYIGLDDKNPSQYAIFIGQVSLGLPTRDNYFNMADHDVEMRSRYVELIQKLLDPAGRARLIPRQGHDTLAEDILDFEKKLANFSLPPDQMRDPEKLYNRRKISDLPAALHLSEYFTSQSIDTSLVNDTVVVDNPAFFDSIGEFMASLDKDEATRSIVRGYLAFHLARLGSSLGLLGESAYVEGFKFKQYAYGIQEMPEKWKICQSFTVDMLGDAVGAAFVEKYFRDSQMDAAKSLAVQITSAFGKTLKTLDWMDQSTRKAAEDKLGAINWKVGYSSKPDTYDDVVISSESLSKTVSSILEHGFKRVIGHLGQPADKTQWSMNFQEVNAYYSPVRNEMVFPAGILQPPFFSDAYPDAMNYGSIGAVVGHEMSHGFDASGRKYDKDGMLRSWWSPEAADEYTSRSQCFVDLFNTFKPRDVDIYVKGDLTLNENIADTNGASVAFLAFKALANNSKDGIDPPNGLLAKELTNDQLFFVSYAQTWCTLYRPEALKIQMMTDPHSPGMFRVQGPLSQSDVFANAFNCRNGTRYNPTSKCQLW